MSSAHRSEKTGLGVTLLVLSIYGVIAATLQYHVSTQQVDPCMPYTRWMQPAALGLIGDLVMFCIILLLTGSRKVRRIFLVLSTLVAIAGLAISSMHMSQVFDNLLGRLGSLWRNGKKPDNCKAPPSSVKTQLQWTSASLVGVFGLVILLCFSWYIHEIVTRNIHCSGGTVATSGASGGSGGSGGSGASGAGETMGGGCPIYEHVDFA